VNVVELNNVEGDDIIANFVRQSKRKNIIVSTDKDFLQLVDDHTSVYRPGRLDKLVTPSNIMNYCKELFKLKKLKFKPSWLCSMRILVGDASDNIPGASGVGELRSVQLFNQCGDDPNAILEYLKPIPKKLAWQTNIIKFIESGNWELNSKLMDLTRGPKIPIKDLIQASQYNYSEAYQFMTDLKVGDFIFEDEINRLICAYECLTN
jgi:5'-3' exonuclease